ncbi:MAG: MurB family protein [Oceanobacter sp.]|nr:MAG: MurB family protein [Oceanobacter sp.]
MKVSILTQPLGRNYGGLLQAYALQLVLKNLGCDVETLNRRKYFPVKVRLISHFKYLVKNILAKFGVEKYLDSNRNPCVNLEYFRDNFILLSPLVESDRDLLSYYSLNNFDVFLVGSDQVWRPCYSPKLSNYFLDFCDDLHLKSKRVAYAASFGVDEKEFTEEEVAICRPLAKRFDAMSVREDSGVELLRDYFNVDSEVVLDPTLLLDVNDYEYLIKNDGSTEAVLPSGVLAYILDMDESKEGVVEKVCNVFGSTPFYMMNNPTRAKSRLKNRTEFYPRVGDWLNSFKSADFVVTDSFHGCVFSIIFNKQFLVIGNKSRGLARFHSILRRFGLESRLVDDSAQVDSSLVLENIDWTVVNKIKNEGRKSSLDFIKDSSSI